MYNVPEQVPTRGINAHLRARYYRKKKWAFDILGNVCRQCGKTTELQIDHIDPTSKCFDVTVMLRSRTEEDILKELEKCQLLCKECHREKSNKEKPNSGESNGSAVLKQKDIPEIKRLISEGLSLRELGRRYGVSHVSILYIKKGITWV